ncbi:MAG: phosphoribosylaminoimidazolesuccinocarboxamide synthase [Planctomycetaceae bacterium]|jgi:phosphoribosylaminoimidazole-succinocarboxamide synthase|nr:phosphoribosylaminoimidazolesuccinocarboxamide synthase [Planctomycetaceae bacterium]
MIVLQTSIPEMTPKRGKVRDIYDFGNSLLLVSSDRISAFDWILPTGIPDKGKVLNQMAAFWFRQLGVPNHLLTTDIEKMPFPNGTDLAKFEGRSMFGKKCKVIPIECVVRGYLSGSGWKEYQKSGSVCGIKLPDGLRESDPLPEPIFTPSTKAETGHDENITFDQMVVIVGQDVSEELRQKSLDIFRRGSELAIKKGIIIADTKFEFGFSEGQLTLIDEVLTPDSSRFWSADCYQPGQGQLSFDKQFVRDWLTQSGWDKNSPPPELPNEIVKKTQEKYLEAFQILTDYPLNQTL